MSPRQTWTALFAAAVALLAAGVRFAESGDYGATVRAALAGLLAAGVMLLATSLLPDADWRGLVVGGFFVGAGLLSWTFTDQPLVVWGLLLVEGLVFAVWSWPWLKDLGSAARLGTAWLGVAYWLLGIAGALLVAHWRIAGERLAYAGVFGLAVLAVLARSRGGGSGPRANARVRELSLGVAAGFLYALGAILLAGSGNVFEEVHVVPANEWGQGLEYRFWGGDLLLYQPNSMAALAAVAAIRVGADRHRALWQRLAATGLAGFVVYVTHSRTGWVILAGAGLAHAVLLWSRRHREVAGLPSYGNRHRTIAAAALPVVIAALVVGGWAMPEQPSSGDGPAKPRVTEARYRGGGVTSGRLDTWKQVFAEWRDAGLAEKVFGDATTTRAVVIRESSGADVQLTTDNAAVGALRRGGLLGVVGFLFGLGLLLWHAYRRDAPAWFIVAVLASLPPIMTSDALLGGTGGTVWVLLLAGEAWLVFRAARTPADAEAARSPLDAAPRPVTGCR
ncbi:MAG: hypothetical protein ACRDT4_18005 [Micromonosporaceae bacterium]